MVHFNYCKSFDFNCNCEYIKIFCFEKINLGINYNTFLCKCIQKRLMEIFAQTLLDININTYSWRNNGVFEIDVTVPNVNKKNVQDYILRTIDAVCGNLHFSNEDIDSFVFEFTKQRKQYKFNNFVYCHETIQELLYKLTPNSNSHNYFDAIKLLQNDLIANGFFVYSSSIDQKLSKSHVQAWSIHSEFPVIPVEKKIECRDTGNSVIMAVANMPVGDKKSAICFKLFSKLYGALLYHDIREKRGLSYYAGSDFSVIDEKLYVRIGTQSKNFKCIDDILIANCDKLTDADSIESIFDNIKRSMMNEIYSILDDPFLRISYEFEKDFFCLWPKLEKLDFYIKKVTAEDISKIARNISFTFTMGVIGDENKY